MGRGTAEPFQSKMHVCFFASSEAGVQDLLLPVLTLCAHLLYHTCPAGICTELKQGPELGARKGKNLLLFFHNLLATLQTVIPLKKKKKVLVKRYMNGQVGKVKVRNYLP